MRKREFKIVFYTEIWVDTIEFNSLSSTDAIIKCIVFINSFTTLSYEASMNQLTFCPTRFSTHSIIYF